MRPLGPQNPPKPHFPTPKTHQNDIFTRCSVSVNRIGTSPVRLTKYPRALFSGLAPFSTVLATAVVPTILLACVRSERYGSHHTSTSLLSTITDIPIVLDPFTGVLSSFCPIVILTVLSFTTYCDCPYLSYLDLKLCLFYSAVSCVCLLAHIPVLLTSFEIVGLCSFRLI
jgi:NADH:ubiquinone oxidoreductase subunit 5 (subunit L)/multisubunit Na+/H+ antiporter MnhA subunit